MAVERALVTAENGDEEGRWDYAIGRLMSPLTDADVYGLVQANQLQPVRVRRLLCGHAAGGSDEYLAMLATTLVASTDDDARSIVDAVVRHATSGLNPQEGASNLAAKMDAVAFRTQRPGSDHLRQAAHNIRTVVAMMAEARQR